MPLNLYSYRAAAFGLVVSFFLAQPALADFEAGQRAWDAGDTVEALAQWQVAAEASDPRAMLALGRLYREGLGVLQDYVEAYKWFNLAASRGNAKAASERNDLSASMTPEQLAEGQSLARAWRPGAGQGSGPAEPALPSPPPPDAIQEAQGLLSALGYQPGPADGIWGRRSAEAYRSFLRDAGLPASDALTPQALLAMRSIAQRGDPQAGPDAAAAPGRAAQASPSEAIRQAQDLLAALGYEAGPADGQWGALSAQAYAAFLGDAGLPSTGTLTPEGLRALHARTEAQGADRGPVAPARQGAGLPADVLHRATGGDPALVALLEGRTWAEVQKAAEEAERLARQPAGTEFRDCADCPLMVVVPSGSFMMGSPEGEEGRWGGEGPVHRVDIVKPFAAGKHGVTRGAFAQFVEATGHSMGNSCGTNENGAWEERRGRGWKRPGFSQSDSHPVVCVNWEDVQAYVDWLSREAGAQYRLLSEAEWEYAARAGTTGPFHFGSTISTDQANYDGNFTYGSGRKGVYREETVPVGSFPANGFGLHDMHGNVWEWVEDCWHDSYASAPADGSVWTSGGDCSLRVLRGGSWFSSPVNLRSATRNGSTTGNRDSYFGFRVARTLIP